MQLEVVIQRCSLKKVFLKMSEAYNFIKKGCESCEFCEMFMNVKKAFL